MMQIKRIIKWFLYFIIFLVSLYNVTFWRTTFFGVSINSIGGQLITAFIYIFPLSLGALLFLKLAGYNLRIKNFVQRILIIALLVIVLSETWASSEEYMFKKKCAGEISEVMQSRWRPFSSNYLVYDKEDGFYAGD